MNEIARPEDGIYEHTKTGKRYRFVTLVIRESDLEPYVIYAPMYDEGEKFLEGLESIAFCRPLHEFVGMNDNGERRFVPIEESS